MRNVIKPCGWPDDGTYLVIVWPAKKVNPCVDTIIDSTDRIIVLQPKKCGSLSYHCDIIVLTVQTSESSAEL